jgi:DNA-binding NarL/FixJ family response regulator
MILIAVRDLLFSSKIDAAAKRVGARIAWASRGASLVEAAREHRPDAVLIDLGAPRALEEVRSLLSERPEVRVIAFVGHLRTDLIDEARALGVADVLTRGQLSANLEDVLAVNGGTGASAH